MQHILVATDSDAVFAELDAALGSSGCGLHRVWAGADVLPAVIESDPDLIVLDLQIGAMGGFATCIDLRHEESADRLPTQRILLLIDREADDFLARRSGADGWILKPLDAIRLRRAVAAVLEGNTWAEAADVLTP